MQFKQFKQYLFFSLPFRCTNSRGADSDGLILLGRCETGISYAVVLEELIELRPAVRSALAEVLVLDAFFPVYHGVFDARGGDLAGVVGLVAEGCEGALQRCVHMISVS